MLSRRLLGRDESYGSGSGGSSHVEQSRRAVRALATCPTLGLATCLVVQMVVQMVTAADVDPCPISVSAWPRL